MKMVLKKSQDSKWSKALKDETIDSLPENVKSIARKGDYLYSIWYPNHVLPHVFPFCSGTIVCVDNYKQNPMYSLAQATRYLEPLANPYFQGHTYYYASST